MKLPDVQRTITNPKSAILSKVTFYKLIDINVLKVVKLYLGLNSMLMKYL